MNDITEGYKKELGTGEMFNQIAYRYDLLNKVMSFFLDKYWRKQAVNSLNLDSGHLVLDLATGTADVAMEIVKYNSKVKVIGVDPSDLMLEIGRKKILSKSMENQITLKNGDAVKLNFEDDFFNSTVISFGIRNVKDRKKAIMEMSRVTKKNGIVSILELSEPEGNSFLSIMSKFYIQNVIPIIGSILSGVKEYKYLQDSIQKFPSINDFSKILNSSGLEVLYVKPLTFGVCNLYVCKVTKDF